MLRIILLGTALCFATTSVAQEENPPTATKAEFDALKERMKYEEVVRIIGGEGELMSEAGRVQVYAWAGEGGPESSLIITFNNGRLFSKAQYGLK